MRPNNVLAAFPLLCVSVVVAAPIEDIKARGGGLEDLTEPLVEGAVNPLTTGIGRGVAGAAAGTQQTADLLGDAIDALLHTVGGIATNAEQGAGVAVANAAPAVQEIAGIVGH